MASTLRQRLLRDVAEMQVDPYPNVILHMNDTLTQACLILSPEGQKPLHLTMVFHNYPLQPPVVTIQSKIRHPNVLGTYICASILNTTEGYTPAYTLKSIAIQLLSFFSSETLEQDHGGLKVDLEQYRRSWKKEAHSYHCVACGFDNEAKWREKLASRLGGNFGPGSMAEHGKHSRKRAAVSSGSNSSDSSGARCRQAKSAIRPEEEGIRLDERTNSITPVSECVRSSLELSPKFFVLPDEILLMIFSELSNQDLWAVAKVFPVTSEILNSYDFIRVRELQCFCLKESFMKAKLGVGVYIYRKGREGIFESEFDLLSQQAFQDYGINRSVQGLNFGHWLPLAISRRHWRSVRADVYGSLQALAQAANLKDPSGINVIYHFMNDVVVKFSQEAEKYFGHGSKSSLTHASEKAVESYFALFHLLLCLANEDPAIIRAANAIIDRFLQGATSKISCPNLGHLLVAALVSDAGMTEQLRHAMIEEAVLRNVVWMLDPKGAHMPELAYLEPSPISEYRLGRSFQASKTSYRLLMFLILFYDTARGEGKSLASLCDQMFDAHGAPPRGTAEYMAGEIRRIKDVDSFPPFFIAMGLRDVPSKENFTAFLRRMVIVSEMKGYSRMPMTQGEALALRKRREPGVEVAKGVVCGSVLPKNTWASFFPGEERNERGGRGGREGVRGIGRGGRRGRYRDR